jgi:hypothetical protein
VKPKINVCFSFSYLEDIISADSDFGSSVKSSVPERTVCSSLPISISSLKNSDLSNMEMSVGP